MTVVSKGNAVATTTGSGGAQPANDGIVIPFVNPAGGPILVSTVHPSTITPPPSKEASNPPSDPNCQQCSIYFEYINVYYWPTGNTHNTACLSGVTDKPITALPSGLKPYVLSVTDSRYPHTDTILANLPAFILFSQLSVLATLVAGLARSTSRKRFHSHHTLYRPW